MKSTTTHSAPTTKSPNINPQNLPPDLPPPSPEARRAKSLRPLFDKLTEASTELDEMLATLELSKEETEELLASQKFHSHRQLRTTLLAQQIQLVAQSHARFALEHLARLTESHHPAVARLAATQILSYAGLTPPKPRDCNPCGPLPPTPAPQSKIENPKSKIPYTSLLQTLLLALTLLTLYFHQPAPASLQARRQGTSLQASLYPSPFILYPSPMPSNPALSSFIDQTAALTTPENIHLCTGSPEEYEHLTHEMVETGTLIKLNPEKRPNSFYCRSDPADVARVEQFTFICSQNKSDAGPTNNWADPLEMKSKLTALFTHSMRGRTLYVIPYSMGPIGSPISNIGVELTDSPYVVISMHIMARIGTKVLDALGDSHNFVRGTHSLGAPLDDTAADVPWPHNAQNKYICHFPESREILSFGSGYGGNALLGKKCHALRIASVQARDEGWLAEHMLILKLTSPAGQSKFIAGAFPSACGKTNLAMLDPTLVGWKVETIGDDIAWMKFGPDRKLYAINPEAGFFGVAPGTSYASNANAMKTITRNTLFTNCALTHDDDIWWEEMTRPAPDSLIDWTRRPWNPKSRRKAAHPNARFTVPARQCPVIAPEWEDPAGVPISAILFGGRRASSIPLVQEALSWQHGVFLGSIMASETTAAATGKTGTLRRDPMAMLPFCGYHMADYFAHWLKIGNTTNAQLPRIFHVNWFRKDAAGKFLWPGYGENSRVLKWIFDRCNQSPADTTLATSSPIGYLPTPGSIDRAGLPVSDNDMKELLKFDPESWRTELPSIRTHYAQFADKLPPPLTDELNTLESQLNAPSL